jgi:hypothetical protein
VDEESTPNGAGARPSRTRDRFRGLAIAFGLVGLLCSWWSAAVLMLLASKVLVVTSHLDGYRPATFTVVRPVHRKEQMRRAGQASVGRRIYAEGTIEGRDEELDLEAYLETRPGLQEELEREVRPGQELPALYNPDVPNTVVARALYPRRDFEVFWMSRRRAMWRVAYLPWAVALSLGLLATAVARSGAGVKLGIASMVFVLAGWLLVGQDVFTR